MKQEIINGLKKYWWILGIALLIKIFKPDLLGNLNIQTQSIFGGLTGFGISLGVFLILLGGILIIIPTPVTTIPGVIVLVVGAILGYGSFMSLLNDIFSGASSTIAIVILVLLGFLVIKRLTK